ncbi:hypothetical protein WICPIJ_003381 [Wickerhamomyces pijperi]|uniref:Uncharacterized protein n=1 Tax=Wickerhamomyces pijperi TaxID=599730 RepID=A0A9P8QA04_WICPI|nr:hypothetical protein WICPIJ_003381 [Wickerhamomyces pijperi]
MVDVTTSVPESVDSSGSSASDSSATVSSASSFSSSEKSSASKNSSSESTSSLKILDNSSSCWMILEVFGFSEATDSPRASDGSSASLSLESIPEDSGLNLLDKTFLIFFLSVSNVSNSVVLATNSFSNCLMELIQSSLIPLCFLMIRISFSSLLLINSV